jgi:D-tyrosyl-tRNA(Tyr) deacylase
MRALLQRVSRAAVSVEGEVIGEIGPGLLIFVAAGKGDDTATALGLADKAANLRMFPDAEGRTNLSLLETGGSALIISQFTLYADCRRGRRPSFSNAADPAPAEALVEIFRNRLDELGIRTSAGRFAADMHVSLDNEGPFTIMLDSEELSRPRREHERRGPRGQTADKPSSGEAQQTASDQGATT